MPLVLIASFLTGALLTLLIPICLLIALVVWMDRLVRRHGQEAETSDLGRTGAEASGTGSEAAASAPGSGAEAPSGA